MAMQIRKGDNVLVIAGKDKGKSEKVLSVDPTNNAVVITGVNIVSKHKKARSAEDKGGIFKSENKVDASNAQIICPACGKATRVAHTIEGDKKSRACKKCGASLDKAVVAKKTTKASSEKSTTKAAAKPATKSAAASKAKTTKTATKSAPKSEKAPKATAAKKSTSTSTRKTSSKSSGK